MWFVAVSDNICCTWCNESCSPHVCVGDDGPRCTRSGLAASQVPGCRCCGGSPHSDASARPNEVNQHAFRLWRSDTASDLLGVQLFSMSGSAKGVVTFRQLVLPPQESERACRYSWVEQCSGWGVVRRWAELRTHEVTDAVIWCFVTSRECWCGGRTRSPRTTHTNDRRTTKVVAGENQMVRSLGRIAGRYPPAVAAHRASGSRGVRSRTWRPVPRTSWR